jgi:VWFA-related protein
MPGLPHRRPVLLFLILLVLTVALAPARAADPPKNTAPPADLAPRHAEFLEQVAPLISEKEKEAFLSLRQDYQRDAFIQRFWQARDPYPKTPVNELKTAWDERLVIAKERYQDLKEDRAKILLILGEPARVLRSQCSDVLLPLEIWSYDGAGIIRNSFSIVFLQPQGASHGRYRLWYPSEGIQSLLSLQMRAPSPDSAGVEKAILEQCPQADDLLGRLGAVLDWSQVESKVIPKPGGEWLSSFLSYSTDVPEGASTFPARIDLSFPGRYGSRTTVQGVVSVPRDAVQPETIRGSSSYSFLVDGEVLYKGELFEHFRYRFVLPETEVAAQARAGLPQDSIPLVFQRYLRPGDYSLVLRIEDTAGERYYRETRELSVPTVETTEAELAAAAAAAPAGAAPAALAEANAGSPGSDEQSIRILPPPPGLMTGKVRLEATTTGEGVARVSFALNGKPILTKSRPPYSVELNLGDQPRIHTLTAVALGASGEKLAEDQILLNTGPHRFAIRLVEPQAGKTYRTSLRAQAQVEVPEGEHLDHVELYLNETLIATLYQPPYVQPMLIPQDKPLSYVRAVAYLADGNSTEDTVLVNAPDYGERLNVQLVELYTSVVDRRQRPVEGLSQGDFKVFEDGQEQEVRRFERVRDVPIYAGLLLDVSGSMGDNGGAKLKAAERGALEFFDSVLTPKDRAAVITFNQHPNLVVRFTNDKSLLEGGLAGLTAEGDTALHDSLIYALYYFGGIKGKRAIILLSDGEDYGSKYSFDEALDYARRSGVSIYPIGLSIKQFETRTKLQRLADETGGRTFFIDAVGELPGIFQSVQEELRSQYLIAYQSSNSSSQDKFRMVEVKVGRPGLEAKTMRGYYP